MRVRFRAPPELEPLLPRPVPARDGLPEWLRAMPQRRFSGLLRREVQTLKQCPPFVDAMATGFLMPLAADVRVESGRFAWDWDPPVPARGEITRSPLSLHVPEQAEGAPFADPEAFVVKFNNFWCIELEPGWSLLATHPLNRDDLPFRSFTGLVDADLYGAGLIQFPARWTDPAFEGVLPRGTPIAQCLPVRREALELVFETLDETGARAFAETTARVAAEPGAYRRHYRGSRP